LAENIAGRETEKKEKESKEFTLEIKSPAILVLLVFLALAFFMELQVTLNTPISFGDEGFHTRMSQWIGENAELPVFRPFEGSDIDRTAFESPPMWTLLEGSFTFLFGFHDVFIKVLTPFIAFLGGVSLFLLGRKIYNEKVAFVAAVIFATTPSLVTYSVLFYMDVMLAFFFTLFLLTFIIAVQNSSKKYWLLSGIFGGLTVLTKTPGIAVFFFIILVFLYQLFKERKLVSLFSLFKKYFVLVAIVLLVCTGFFVRSFYYYKSPDADLPLPFFKPVWRIYTFNETYQFAGRTESVSSEASLLGMGITQFLNFAYGNIWFVVLGGLAGISLILMRRKEADILLFLTFVTMFFILSQSISRAEDTARHVLAWVPVIALFAAVYFEQLYDFIKVNLKKLGIVALVIFAVVLFFGYQAMADKLTTMAQVKQFSPAFFEACNWVKINLPKNSSLYTVWAHRAAYNCQTNAMGTFADLSLSEDLNHTLLVAKQQGVTHIFIQKFSIDFQNQHFSEKYDWNFVKFLEAHPEHFVNVFENGPSLDVCVQQGSCDGNIIYEIKY